MPGLEGSRILVVEDELLVALDLKSTLAGLGCDVVGPLPRVESAIEAVESALDGAVLDINLRGRMSYDVADALARRRVPFFFLTGYDEDCLPERFRGVLCLVKPVTRDELAAAASEAFGRAAPRRRRTRPG